MWDNCKWSTTCTEVPKVSERQNVFEEIMVQKISKLEKNYKLTDVRVSNITKHKAWGGE